MAIDEELLAKELGRLLLSYAETLNASQLAAACDTACRRALGEIQAVVSDDSLSDFACIEAIVRILEHCGGSVGGRHDF